MNPITRETWKRACSRIESAFSVLSSGGIVLVRDNENRENEGDLICAADHATAGNIAFMAVHGRGLVCHAITQELADRLDLPPMARENTESHSTAFTVSVDAVNGTTTGISAADRAQTIAVTIARDSQPEDLRRPGHVFPVVARPGGVFERPGHTEAAVDLARLSGLTPSGVICEVLNDDGTMARGHQLESMAERFNLPLVSVEDLIIYRDRIGDVQLTSGPEVELPTDFGRFTVTMYRSSDPAAAEALLLRATGPTGRSNGRGNRNGDASLVRVHSECLTGETLHSKRCDCRSQLEHAMRRIAMEGGYLVYLRQEGRGIGLFDKLRAYALQDQGMDTVDANVALGHSVDLRRYGTAAAILRSHNVKSIRLMTNNPDKLDAFSYSGIEVVRHEPLTVGKNSDNGRYLHTKLTRLGHLLEQTR